MDKYKFLKFDELEEDGKEWLKRTLDLAKVQHVGALMQLCFTSRSNITRDVLAKALTEATRIVNRQNQYIVNLEKQAQQLKSEVIVNQGNVIDLQKELLAAKNQQLNDIKATVVASVEDSVKSEIKSYSDAVLKTRSSTPGVVLDKKTLASVVKDVVSEEDRSRNLMIFGLSEDPNEQICDKVSQVLLELGEKPKVEASRLGLTSSKGVKKVVRPVKVTVTSSTIVHQILSKARTLRHSDQYKDVFISPDRSVEQRELQKQLVLELKKKTLEEPNKRHYIKGGQLFSADKIAK